MHKDMYFSAILPAKDELVVIVVHMALFYSFWKLGDGLEITFDKL